MKFLFPGEGRDPSRQRHDVFYVYLLASKPYGTLYVGVTSELARRVWEHKIKAVPGFTARYSVDRLVWFETHHSAEAAERREKQIKEWKRDWKFNLIEHDNAHWADLYPKLTGLQHPDHGHRPSPV
jgi:putative endonuclease